MVDQGTLQAYAEHAADYASKFASERPDRHLQSFMDGLPKAARILDLGCGPGHASAHMAAAGFHVDAWDASSELAAIGKEQHGLAIEIRTFETLDAQSIYDGVFANFSLLHVPKSAMPTHLSNIANALKPGGLFHIGVKTGTGEKRDRLGRFYAFYTDEELTGLLEDAGLTVLTRDTGAEAGLEGSIDPWIVIKAKKS